MTIEEKRKKLIEHCFTYGCDGCPVHPLVRDGNENCFSPACDGVKAGNIERNYNLVFGVCEPGENPYWERISDIADKQRTKGMSKYGVGLENNTANATERVRHIQEELIDALMYLTWLEESLKEGEADDQ